MSAVRILVVWCPDWPAVAGGVAAGASPADPVAVVAANRVVASNAMARAEGVRRGLRRREAQARCPRLAVLADDPARDARLFEPVVAAVEELAPGVEVVRPGVVAVPAAGPAGYFGGELRAAERLVDHVASRAGVECQIGIADGLFPALLAALRGAVVAAGGSAEFLAPLDIGELARYGPSDPERAVLVDLLRRLGLRTLGAFAALPERVVSARFGADVVRAHRLARGESERPLARRNPPYELVVREAYDPPLERVDAAAFAARALATRLCAALSDHGLACTRLGIRARTGHGEELYRVWRCAEPLIAAAPVTDRVRWQLEGWLTAGNGHPTAGLAELYLEPEETVAGQELQLPLWRGDEQAERNAERAGRALLRVQALLGPGGAVTAVLGGGRGPRERVRLVPWGDESSPAHDPAPPWPGRLPAPSPAVVPPRPLPATVLDTAGCEVGVTGRHELTGTPGQVVVAGAAPRPVLGWAGPWPVDERWWDGSSGQRLARLQVLLAATEEPGAAQTALLLARTGGHWQVEGEY